MKVILGFVLMICAWPCFAGHVYRCPDGSFQDKPCGDGGVVVAKNRPPPQAGSIKACVEAGQRAEEIAKLKGQSVKLEALLADIDTRSDGYDKKLEEKKFTVDAYKFGSPAEARVSVEAECVAGKNKAAVTATTGAVVQPPAAATGGPSAEQRAQQAAADHSASERAARDRTCAQYKDELMSVKAQQREPNSPSRMDSLNKRKRDIEKKVSDSCS